MVRIYFSQEGGGVGGERNRYVPGLVVDDGLGEFDESVMIHRARLIVNQANARQLLPTLRYALQ